MSSIKYHKDLNDVVHIVFDRAGSPVNLMDLAFADDLTQAIERLLEDDFIGVVMRSTKSTFFAGGDLSYLSSITEDTASQVYEMSMQMKTAMRALETCGKPVVACINGSALGGGFELALACHHRIALNHKGMRLGLPEVGLGLLPGAGGLTKMVRLLGLAGAMPYLTEGKLFSAIEGKAAGLIDQVVEEESSILAAALRWIKDNPQVQQPFDIKGYKIPGGTPSTPKVAQFIAACPAIMRKTTKGTLPAPEAILSCMVEGAQVDIDSALRIESRYFAELCKGKVSKNLINTLWFAQNAIKGGMSRPDIKSKTQFSKVGVLGAGMMGAGIAYACISKGIAVVLKDVDLATADKGKDQCQKLLSKRGREDRLKLLQTTESYADLADCELVIEAVFEDRSIKAEVTKQTAQVTGEGAVIASNTSTLPISGLAEATEQQQNFIGIHFFSPVDKMPLVEIICGEQTSDDTLAKAWDLTVQLGKTPIVVNDSRGFYTSRVFKTYVKEGIAMLSEAKAASVENAAFCCGFPVGPLAVTDEVSLTLIDSIEKQTREDDAADLVHPADGVLQKMLERGRKGKYSGGGFYDYGPEHEKHLWPALAEFHLDDTASIDFADIKDRLLFIMALETAQIYQEGVLRSVAEANVGAIFGIGYPQWTGGTLQFINQYPLVDFVKRANALAARYGERFKPCELLEKMAQNGERFE